MLIFEIEGHQIQCVVTDGRRQWSCPCDAFEDRVREQGYGYCQHTARAIMQAILVGQIRRWG